MGENFVDILELIFGNVLTFLFIFLILGPILARRRRFADLTAAFTRLQKKRKSRIITLVHRLEPMGFLGIPQFGYIDLNDSEEVIQAIRATPPDKPLEIMMHTPGGLVLAALQIARAVKAHPGPTRVFVPHFAMSGGTMIALAADEIVMSDHAILGPIDPQIDGIPAASIVRTTEAKSTDATEDFTLILADISQMAIDQVKAAARELLGGTISDNAANNIAEQLASGRWTHDYPIYAGEARELGLNVSTDMPKDFVELMAMFPNTLANRSGVRYATSRFFGGLFGRREKSDPRRDNGAITVAPQASQPTVTPSIDGIGRRQISFGPWSPSDLERHGQMTPHRQEGRPRGRFKRF
ncbi:MAG: hypothetical protein AAF850_11870 [Pseudomonadota bacterium]